MAAPSGINDQGNANVIKPIAMLTPKAAVADHLPRLLTTPFSRQATI